MSLGGTIFVPFPQKLADKIRTPPPPFVERLQEQGHPPYANSGEIGLVPLSRSNCYYAALLVSSTEQLTVVLVF